MTYGNYTAQMWRGKPGQQRSGISKNQALGLSIYVQIRPCRSLLPLYHRGIGMVRYTPESEPRGSGSGSTSLRRFWPFRVMELPIEFPQATGAGLGSPGDPTPAPPSAGRRA